MAKKKFYAVTKGLEPGIYDNWADTEAQVKGYPGAKFKGYSSYEAAEKALSEGIEYNRKPAVKDPASSITPVSADYIKNSISVDAACSGNPGEMEYQGVDTESGALVFFSEIYPSGTNNIGEFLAVVHALQYLKDSGDKTTPIYSDSVSAISWVRRGRVKTSLELNASTETLFQDIDEAEQWLRTSYNSESDNPILKWHTKDWGESKADFGRK